MIVSGGDFSIRSARLEGAVVQCIKDWATAFPAELVAFDQQMKMKRATQPYHSNSPDNAGAAFGEVPVRLNGMMCRRIHKNWLHQAKIANLFFSHFKVGLIRPNDRLKTANLREGD